MKHSNFSESPFFLHNYLECTLSSFYQELNLISMLCVLIFLSEYFLIKYFVELTLEICGRDSKIVVVVNTVSLIIKDGCIFPGKLANVAY